MFLSKTGEDFKQKLASKKYFSQNQNCIQKCLLKSVINHVTTKNQNLRLIDIGSLKSVNMITNFGFKLIQRSSIISVSQNSEHNIRRTEFQFFQAYDANINIFVARTRTEFEFTPHFAYRTSLQNVFTKTIPRQHRTIQPTQPDKHGP